MPAVATALVLLLLSTVLVAMAPQGPAPAPDDWAFRPLQAVEPPATGDPDWDAHPVDRFVRRAQQQHGLEPSPPADRRTLLRRASVALTGLLPTPASVAAFAADPRPDAFAAVVDQLLASPHYGEQQARHWLDLARYSDSNGLDENLAFAQAFRYRDWVVQAHNADLPFDRFGTLQLAGDLLAAEPGVGPAGHLATGFLALGPRMLAEQDKEKLQLDTVDEQLDLVGRTFLGLTLGCARCHDHKFDPIPQRDYYALASVFRSTRSFHDLGHVSKWYDRELASDAAIAARQAAERALADAEQQLAAARRDAAAAQREQLLADAGRYLLAGQAQLEHSRYLEAEAAAATSLHADDRHWGSADCAVLHSHQAGPQFATYALEVAVAGDYELEVRYAAAEARPMRVLVDGQEVAAAALGATTGGWFPAHQRWHRAATVALAAGRHELRLEARGAHAPHLDALWLAPAGARADGLLPPVVRSVARRLAATTKEPVLALWQQLAAHDDAALAAAAAAEQGKGGLHALLLGGLPPTSRRELAARYQTLFAAAGAAAAAQRAAKPEAEPVLAEPTLEAVRRCLFGPGGLLAVADADLQPYLPAAAAAAVAARQAARDAAAAAVPKPAPTAICVADGPVVELPVMLRGNHLTPAAQAVPRGYLSALATVPGAPMPPDQSGRRQLAAWLFAPEQPLVPRVLANRIWQRAFGHGLVRSPSNFGRTGDRPVHGPLLDWLAQDLRAHGWSQKHLWRRLLTSRTWQQQSAPREDAERLDPDNRLWWRQQRQRLAAESIRDAMLQASGQLDPALGGTLLGTADRGYVTNDQSNAEARYDSRRRSLYLPIIRNAIYEVFAAFDYVDPSVHLEQRPQSAVATQALWLLNAPFVRQQAAALAERAAAPGGGDDAAIDGLWQLAYQRAPRAAERAAAHRWLQAARGRGAAAEALPGLAQALLASNEFSCLD